MTDGGRMPGQSSEVGGLTVTMVSAFTMFRRDVHFGFYFHYKTDEKLTVRFSAKTKR